MTARIKELRKALGIKQSEFGARIGIKQSSVTAWETGVRNPTDMAITSICRVYNVSEAWLRDGVGEMFVERTMNQEIAMMANELMSEADDSFRKRFVSALLEIPPEMWPHIEKFINKLAATNKDA